MYQQDIFRWNQDNMATLMSSLDFQFEVFPVPLQHLNNLHYKQNMSLVDRPMSFEKDEIKLRDKFFYKQAYFYKQGALQKQNISDIIWVGKNLD